jgi:hypothetical protein
MNIQRDLTTRRMGYGMNETVSAVGLMIDGTRVEIAWIRYNEDNHRVAMHFDCDPASPNAGASSVEDFHNKFKAEKAYHQAFAPYLVGRRVRLTTQHEVYPTGIFEVGLTGTVASIEDYSIWVKMDEHREEIDEWDNQLQFCAEGWYDDVGREMVSIEYFLDCVEFINGDVLPVPDEDPFETLTDDMIHDAAFNAINALLQPIQRHLGITSGDVAGLHDSGPEAEQLREALTTYARRYVELERMYSTFTPDGRA